MYRIRTLMGKRDDLYSLTRMIEFDEGFFEIATSENERKSLKRGKGSQRKEDVGVIVESTPLEDKNTGDESKHCRYFKMKVLDSQKSDNMIWIIHQKLDWKIFVWVVAQSHRETTS